jgi:hypothetical protein
MFMNCSDIKLVMACWCRCGMQWKWDQIAKSVFIRQAFCRAWVSAGGMFGHDMGKGVGS